MDKKNRKPTNGELIKRIKNAVVLVDKTKDTESIFFSDKGLRLTVNDEYAVIETGYHRHVYTSYTMSGLSRPWMYTKRIIEIALENDCSTPDGMSYAKLTEVLKEKEDQTEYNIAVYYSWFLFNVFQPLYSIGESEIESFLVYEDYVHNIARQSVLLSEKTEDMTNRQFVEKVLDNIKEFTENMEERVLFHKKTDAETVKENMEAVMQQEQESAIGNEGQ